MDRKDIRITTWNANGIDDRKEILHTFLIEQKIDICLLSETHLTKQCQLKIPGYDIFTSNHPDNQAHGGSAIVIKKILNTT